MLIYLQVLSQLKLGDSALLAQFGTVPFAALGILILAFSLYHSITWFVLSARAQPIKIRGFTLSGGLAFVVNLALMVIMSLIVVTVVFGIDVRLGLGV